MSGGDRSCSAFLMRRRGPVWSLALITAIVLAPRLTDPAPAATERLSSMMERESPGFHGPNCFNTALVTTGVLDFDDVRYVDSEEFEFLLLNDFDEVNGEPERGDLVLYNASKDRSHAAVYLGEGLVFHKKDWHAAYLYRVVDIDDVFLADPGDDRAFRPEDQLHSPNDDAADRAFFRPKASRIVHEIPADLAPVHLVLSHIHGAVIDSGPRWRVGLDLGIVTERFMISLLWRLNRSKALSGLAKSLYWQIHQSIVAEHFASPYAQHNPDPIESEIYFSDNDYLSKLIGLAGRMQGIDVCPEAVDVVISRLEADRATRSADFLEEVRTAREVCDGGHP